MPLVVGVSFKKAGKVYYFDPAGLELSEGNLIIAETARGIEFGEIAVGPKEVPEDEIVSPLKRIVRVATDADVAREETNAVREKQAMVVCQQKIQTHSLPMKLIDAEYCFDGSQVTFYFSSESRVDFRELVKDLASTLKTKVQLHQVGVRDEARFFGGIGPCGRPLCCATFLNGFEPVSMKMAKEQCLFLNPLKFSGICGKLMCCLKFEYPMYRDAKARLPEMGSTVLTPKGPGRVVELNMVKESMGVEIDGGVVLQYTLDELATALSSTVEHQPHPHECCGGCRRDEDLLANVRLRSPAADPVSAPALVEDVVQDGGVEAVASGSTSDEEERPVGEGRPRRSRERRRRSDRPQRGCDRPQSPKQEQPKPTAEQPRPSAAPQPDQAQPGNQVPRDERSARSGRSRRPRPRRRGGNRGASESGNEGNNNKKD